MEPSQFGYTEDQKQPAWKEILVSLKISNDTHS